MEDSGLTRSQEGAPTGPERAASLPPDRTGLDGGPSPAEPSGDEAARFLADNARLADELVDRFCEESRRLEGGSIPPAQAQRTRDAWAYMAVRIDWEGGDRPPGLLRLGSPLRQRLREYGDAWPVKIRDYDLQGLDFGWMTELQAFDHWDVLRDVRAREPSGTNFMAVSIPNFFELMNWTRLRFGRAMGVGDWASASSDVRHLATLLRTTGLVVADMVAYRILKVEREAHAAAIASGRPVGGWQPLPEEELEGYRRVTRSGMQLFAPGVSEATMRKAFQCAGANRCSSLFEGVGAHASYGQYSGQDSSRVIEALANASGCDPRMLQWLQQSRQVTAEEMLGAFSDGPNPLQLLRPDGGS